MTNVVNVGPGRAMNAHLNVFIVKHGHFHATAHQHSHTRHTATHRPLDDNNNKSTMTNRNYTTFVWPLVVGTTEKNVYAKPCTIRTMHVLRMLTRYCYQSGMCSAIYLLVMALVRRSNAYITHKIKRCLYIICACSSMVILGRRWMGLNSTNNAEELYECAVVWKCVCMFLNSLATAYWSSAKAWQRHRWYTYMTGEDTNSNWHICIALLPSIRLRLPLERVLVGLP